MWKFIYQSKILRGKLYILRSICMAIIYSEIQSDENNTAKRMIIQAEIRFKSRETSNNAKKHNSPSFRH